ncbi:MAG: glycoside hydrolase family 9 protein [Bacteroidaceae bacterium]|nr:glycoside hydrolase family 9 protein [Bacteroidaceae bacterium]
MRRVLIILAVACGLSACGNGTDTSLRAGRLTTDSLLEVQLCATDLLHAPLPVDTIRSLEAAQRRRKVLHSEQIPITPTLDDWQYRGWGSLTFAGDSTLCLTLPVETGHRAIGSPNDPDYATYGRASFSTLMHGRSLETFNRISLEVFPRCEGTAVMNLNLHVENATHSALGAHLINLVPNRWNWVTFEINGVVREQVERLGFYTDLKGRNQAVGDSLAYLVRRVRLECVDQTDKESGWEPPQGEIVYSMTGYLPEGQKTAIVGDTLARTFSLLDAESRMRVYNNKVAIVSGSVGRYGVLDFSEFRREGTYILQSDTLESAPFRIAPDAFTNAAWRLLNYIYCQRCGCEVKGIHGDCHRDVFCDFGGKSISYGGGWHDAGDLSQQTLQTADVAYELTEAYVRYRHEHPVLAHRLLEEAEWGLRFVLRCRLGEGYHASSIGLLHWTDGRIGTADDIHTVRKQNVAYDNFLYAAYEAYAARSMDASPLRDSLAEAAKKDYAFALAKFRRDGYDHFPHIMEHTYNTSPSQFHATMSWAASQLYQLTGRDDYARDAADLIRYTLDCQATGDISGYFYRDTTHCAPVHYIHQSREQLYMQALVALCETQPRHPDCERWRSAIRAYADYLRFLSAYTAPYGMAPSGIYQTGEYADSAGFYSLHIFAPANVPELFETQIRRGEPLDEGRYVRRFPVWFGIFNGNEAILLSAGKAAAQCGRFLDDDALRQIGREQLYWTVGKNPFCQSLIYGEGHRYPSMDSFSSGEIMGEIPVGIRSLGNDDVPYWPQTNNACYKEVWLTSAGKFLSLLAEY